MIEWLAVRGLVTVQDGGRVRGLGLGLAEGGAVDREALWLVNYLLGDDPGTSVLEILGGGFTCCVRLSLTIAFGGHPRPVRADGIALPFYTPWTVDAGTVLELSDGPGAYVMLGVAGGVEGTRRFGSVSEMVSVPSLGWYRPKLAGAVTLARYPVPRTETRRLPENWWPSYGGEPVGIWPGPDPEDGLPAEVVVQATGRMGVRATGRAPEGARPPIGSRATVRGTIEVDQAGTHMILGPERQTTGGYPMPWVVSEWDLGRVFDVDPGGSLRFEAMTVERYRRRRETARGRLAAAVAGRTNEA